MVPFLSTSTQFIIWRGHEINDANWMRVIMVSIRERARTAMAALDRRNPNLDDFVGLNWSSWIDKAYVLASEGESYP